MLSTMISIQFQIVGKRAGFELEDPLDGELDPDRDGVTSFEEYLDGTAHIADSVAQIIFVRDQTLRVGNSNIVNLVYETSDLNSAFWTWNQGSLRQFCYRELGI